MAKKYRIEDSILRALLEYDPATGVLTWRRRPVTLFMDGTLSAAQSCAIWNGKWAGKKAGTRNAEGYVVVKIFAALYPAHRLIWVLMTGEWPVEQIDHVNLRKDDNTWANLREATTAQNAANRKGRGACSKGVYFDKSRGRYAAAIQVGGKARNLGRYATEQEASAAYRKAAEAAHGPFARA